MKAVLLIVLLPLSSFHLPFAEEVELKSREWAQKEGSTTSLSTVKVAASPQASQKSTLCKCYSKLRTNKASFSQVKYHRV